MKKDKLIIAALVFLLICYLVYKQFTQSIFIKKKDRINVLFYGPTTVFDSLGRGENINYFFRIPSNIEIEVPGGYGYYRVGALGKLVSLERDSDILKKSFSALSSSFVDLYFYPRTNSIYYEERESQNFLPTFGTIFMHNSNGNILDKVLLWFFFLQKRSNQYKEMSDLPQIKEHNKALFDREGFFKEFQGFFYNKTYRNINDRVQILYTKSYKTALLISNILEGEGIQVVDISEISKRDNCLVIEDSKKASVVAYDLQKFFGCDFKSGETEVSDIILILGNLEKDWGVE